MSREYFFHAMDQGLWADEWEKARSGFPLAASQKSSPDKWRSFFDKVSPYYHAMWGDQGGFGCRVADFLFYEALAYPSATVLDAGSGPGTISLPLSERGAIVTALDYAPGMLKELSLRASSAGLHDIRTVFKPFYEYEPSEGFDLVLACFFPPALCPQGINKMEKLSRRYCALILGAVGEQIPLRRDLWREIMGEDPPSGAFHLLYAFGFLFSGKRAPNIRHLTWRYTFTRPVEEVEAFFTTYFSIFDKKGKSVRERIRKVLNSFERDGLVVCDSEVNIAVLWWKALNG